MTSGCRLPPDTRPRGFAAIAPTVKAALIPMTITLAKWTYQSRQDMIEGVICSLAFPKIEISVGRILS
ncbi:MAG: hypothetical protein AAF921_20895 [Cyanobacteria bacterium P01_D01_bin.44]